VPRVGRSRVEGDGALEARGRFGRAAVLLVRRAKVDQRRNVIRLERKRPLEARDRLGQAPLCPAHHAELAWASAQPGSRSIAAQERLRRFVEQATLAKHDAEVDLRGQRVRRERQRLAIGRRRFLKTPELLECMSQVAMRLGELRLELRGLPEMGIACSFRPRWVSALPRLRCVPAD